MRISDWSSDVCSSDLEPDFALVKFKKLAGGGYFKIINRTVPAALRKLGYEDRQIEAIIAYAVGYGTLADAPAINHETLAAKRSEEHTSELQSLMRISYAVFCLKNKINHDTKTTTRSTA